MGSSENYHVGYAMINTKEEYEELATMADTAEECLQSLRFGSHAYLIRILYKNHEIRTDRMGAIKEARRLCREYIDNLRYEEMA